MSDLCGRLRHAKDMASLSKRPRFHSDDALDELGYGGWPDGAPLGELQVGGSSSSSSAPAAQEGQPGAAPRPPALQVMARMRPKAKAKAPGKAAEARPPATAPLLRPARVPQNPAAESGGQPRPAGAHQASGPDVSVCWDFVRNKCKRAQLPAASDGGGDVEARWSQCHWFRRKSTQSTQP
ncbi:unnamed protein product [Prorocentrum cordatum]|uniref:Uncharacterized protein n=1 Tax=Prorocentrum cordatum TaxID=2364126 RepID=A0ABN9T8G9_9DINO|nr:unnamed protein product [Polarella glacialis]